MLKRQSATKKILAVFLTVGAIVAIASLIGFWSVVRLSSDAVTLGESLAPQLDASLEIKQLATEAHLKMEEIMAGDAAEDFSEVESLLTRADRMAAVMGEGGQVEGRIFRASDSQAVRGIAAELRSQLAAFLDAARSRHALLDDGIAAMDVAEAESLYRDLAARLADAASRPDLAAVAQRAIGEARFQLAQGRAAMNGFIAAPAADTAAMSDAFAASASAVGSVTDTAFADPGVGAAVIDDIGRLAEMAAVSVAAARDHQTAIVGAEVGFDAAYTAFLSKVGEAQALTLADMFSGVARVHTTKSIAITTWLISGLALLATLVVAQRWLNAVIGYRLAALAGVLKRLQAGDLTAGPPKWRADDDVGVLRDSVAALHEMLLKQKEIQDESDAARRSADNARAAAEKQRAEADAQRHAAEEARVAAEARARSAERFSREFGAVVERTSGGNFDGRITGKFDDADYDRLAAGMNQILSSVQAGIDAILRVVTAMSGGSLSDRVTGEFAGDFGDLQRAVNTTLDKLEEIVAAIRGTGESILGNAQKISQNSGRLADQTTQQAASLEETAAAMEEMSATVRSNARNADEMASLADSAVSRTEAAGQVVEQAVTAMHQIEESARKVSEIVNVINDISFQTNLLALNAGVEAARAGNAGKGFAVVAHEVRQLAQRATEAAGDIGKLIAQSAEDVAHGVRLVTATGEVLTEITAAIGSVAQSTDTIREASREQAAGIDVVSNAVSALDTNTQENARFAEESALAAKDLRSQTEALEDLMRFFAGGAATGWAEEERKIA